MLSRGAAACLFVSCVALVSPRIALAQPPLDEAAYVSLVLTAHPVAAQRSGLSAAAEAERAFAQRWLDPVVSAGVGRGRPTDGTANGSVESQLSVSQVIPWLPTLRASARSREAAATSLLSIGDALRWDVAADAHAAFARLVAAWAVQEIARGAESDARSLRDLVTRRAELGEARESDRIKATVEWLRQQRTLATAEREAVAAEHIVRALAVTPLPQPLAVAVPPLTVPPPLRPVSAFGDLARQHPRLQAAEAEISRQRALAAVAKSARVPDVELSAFRNTEFDKTSSGVALGVRVPLWNANRSDIARTSAAVLLAQAEADRLRLELQTTVESRVRDLQVATGQVTLLATEILPAARRSVDLARFSFEEGETSLLDLLDAQRTFRETEREMADARLALALAIAESQRLLGPDFTPWQ